MAKSWSLGKVTYSSLCFPLSNKKEKKKNNTKQDINSIFFVYLLPGLNKPMYMKASQREIITYLG